MIVWSVTQLLFWATWSCHESPASAHHQPSTDLSSLDDQEALVNINQPIGLTRNRLDEMETQKGTCLPSISRYLGWELRIYHQYLSLNGLKAVVARGGNLPFTTVVTWSASEGAGVGGLDRVAGLLRRLVNSVRNLSPLEVRVSFVGQISCKLKVE